MIACYAPVPDAVAPLVAPTETGRPHPAPIRIIGEPA